LGCVVECIIASWNGEEQSVGGEEQSVGGEEQSVGGDEQSVGGGLYSLGFMALLFNRSSTDYYFFSDPFYKKLFFTPPMDNPGMFLSIKI
jgi:hypothetical protein